MKIKKLLKIIFVILFIFLILEGGTYLNQSARLLKQGYKFAGDSKIPPYPLNIENYTKHYRKNFHKQMFINNKIGINYNKKPVLIFGDVFVKSWSAEKNMAKIISDLLKAPVYVCAFPGWSIQNMYFLLKNEKAISEYNPQTIIYVYMSDQKNRMTSYSFYPHHNYLNLKYKLENGKLTIDNPSFPFLYNSYFVRNMERIHGWKIASSQNIKVKKPLFDLMEELFIESRNIAIKNYPNFKNFVIFRIAVCKDSLSQLKEAGQYTEVAKAEYEMWERLKNQGFTIVDLSDCTPVNKTINKYTLPDSSFQYDYMSKFVPKFLVLAKLMPEQSKRHYLPKKTQYYTKPVITNNANLLQKTETVNAKQESITKQDKDIICNKLLINDENQDNTDLIENKQNSEEKFNIETDTEQVNTDTECIKNEPKIKFWSKFKRKNKNIKEKVKQSENETPKKQRFLWFRKIFHKTNN